MHTTRSSLELSTFRFLATVSRRLASFNVNEYFMQLADYFAESQMTHAFFTTLQLRLSVSTDECHRLSVGQIVFSALSVPAKRPWRL